MNRWLERTLSWLRQLVRRAQPPPSLGPSRWQGRTVILSDLHLGTGQGPYDIFAGEDSLARFVDQLADRPTRLILNGDTFDFLLNEDPLELDARTAVRQAQALAANPATAEALAAMGRLLAAGGEVSVRIGNHDVELALKDVQEVFRRALRQPEKTARRLRFQYGDRPELLEAGGARVLVAHGEHADKWNKIEFARLQELKGSQAPGAEGFTYPAGSVLVKQVLNPLKSQYGMRFVGLLSPEFQGSALAALAVDPAIVKLAFQQSTLSIGWQLWRSSMSPSSFAEGEADLGLAEALQQAGLTPEELRAMQGAAETSFADEAPELMKARVKVARQALACFAGAHRLLAGTAGEDAFRLEPLEAEVREAHRLANRFGTEAVVLGHTHRARWYVEQGLVFANTGTWAWRMRLPSPEEADDVWADFLWKLKRNPELQPDHPAGCVPRLRRLTAVCVEPHQEGGAQLSLIEWDASTQEERALGSARITPRGMA